MEPHAWQCSADVQGLCEAQARRQREKLAGLFGSSPPKSGRASLSQPQAAHAPSPPSQSDFRPAAPNNGHPITQGLHSEPAAAAGRNVPQNGQTPPAASAASSNNSTDAGTSQDFLLDSDEPIDLGESFCDHSLMHHNDCYTCPSFDPSLGLLQQFLQYPRQTRPGACVAIIVTLVEWCSAWPTEH